VRLDGVKPPLPFTVVEMLDLSRWNGGRSEAPWPRIEMSARTLAKGGALTLDERVFKGPALQDFGSIAILGWLSLALIAFVGVLTLRIGSPDAISLNDYQMLAFASFVMSCIAFGLTVLRIIRTALASSVKP
jgi:hypothetical protein